MNRQLTHDTTPFEEKRFPLLLICDGVASPANLGSLFRLADAFSVEKVILCGKSVSLDSARLRKTARGTLERISIEQQEPVLEVCDSCKKEGYTLLALEITDDSLSLDSFRFDQFDKLALIVGNEISGIREEVLEKADYRLHISMFGRNSSMNVAQATGIALYEITKSLQPFQYL